MIKKAVNSSNPVNIAKNYTSKWGELKEELQDLLDKDLASLNEHKEQVDPEIAVLQEYEIQAEMVLKLANWEVNWMKKMIGLTDGNTLSFFRQQSIAQ